MTIKVNSIQAGRQFKFWATLLLAFLLGASFSLALAPFGMIWVALISIGGVYALLKHASPFWIGVSYGTGLWFAGVFWLYTSIHTYGSTPAPLALLLVFLTALIMSLFHGVGFWLTKKLSITPLNFALLWALAEWTKTWLFTGFPWLFAGYSLTQTPFDGLAPVFGVLSLSFMLCWLCATLVEAGLALFQRSGAKPWRLCAAPVLLLVVSALLAPVAWTTPSGKPVQVAMVQGNIPQDLKWLTDYRNKTLEIYAGLSQPHWGKVDLLIWPEAAVPQFQFEVPELLSNISYVAKATQTGFITGIPLAQMQGEEAKFYNGIWATEGDLVQSYKKQRLVPFGEYIPLGGWLDWVLPDLMRSDQVLSFSRGSSSQAPIELKAQVIGSAICYEAAYPALSAQNAKHSSLMLTLSNDAWFGRSHGPLQHLQMVQMRAREAGRSYIRSTNNGVTAVVDSQGKVTARLPQFERGVLVASAQPMQGETPFVRFGMTPFLLIMFGALLIQSYRSFKRR